MSRFSYLMPVLLLLMVSCGEVDFFNNEPSPTTKSPCPGTVHEALSREKSIADRIDRLTCPLVGDDQIFKDILDLKKLLISLDKQGHGTCTATISGESLNVKQMLPKVVQSGKNLINKTCPPS